MYSGRTFNKMNVVQSKTSCFNLIGQENTKIFPTTSSTNVKTQNTLLSNSLSTLFATSCYPPKSATSSAGRIRTYLCLVSRQGPPSSHTHIIRNRQSGKRRSKGPARRRTRLVNLTVVIPCVPLFLTSHQSLQRTRTGYHQFLGLQSCIFP